MSHYRNYHNYPNQKPSRFEQNITDIERLWPEAIRVMWHEILPQLRAGTPITREQQAEVTRTLQHIANKVAELHAYTDRKLRDEEYREKVRQQRAEALEHQRRIDAGEIEPPKPKKSDVQECVDEWLEWMCEQHDIPKEVLADGDTETFYYSVTETIQEERGGEVDFEVPDRFQTLFEAVTGDDLTDELKRHLDSEAHNSFYMDLEGDGDFSAVDCSSEVR